MVRARFIVQVRYGDFAEHLKALEQLNEIARARGDVLGRHGRNRK